MEAYQLRPASRSGLPPKANAVAGPRCLWRDTLAVQAVYSPVRLAKVLPGARPAKKPSSLGAHRL